jgi:hypothetical protein
MNAIYPKTTDITVEMRSVLHPRFALLEEGISEFTFANLYLFRDRHSYRIAQVGEDLVVITGSDGDAVDERFFMLPFGLPETDILERLFTDHACMKAATEKQAEALARMSYSVSEDRDNFDYLYLREELEKLQGRNYHKKKNLVNAFIRDHSYEGRPLLPEHVPDALSVLEEWKKGRPEGDEGDYKAAKEALEMAEELVLCGGIYYADGRPAGFSLGEEIGGGTTWVTHFEKAVSGYRGLYQFINMSFASILPEKYKYVNREQDLGNEGLRRSKLSYKPCAFVKKFRAKASG